MDLDLTEPTLLEMSGNPTTQGLAFGWQGFASWERRSHCSTCRGVRIGWSLSVYLRTGVVDHCSSLVPGIRNMTSRASAIRPLTPNLASNDETWNFTVRS